MRIEICTEDLKNGCEKIILEIKKLQVDSTAKLIKSNHQFFDLDFYIFLFKNLNPSNQITETKPTNVAIPNCIKLNDSNSKNILTGLI